MRARPSLSLCTVLVIILFSISTAHLTKIWCGDSPYCYDAKQYYSYLPKFFLEHDMAFNDRGDYWLDTLPNGKPFIKYSSGIAILQGPFFLLAWLFSHLFKIPLEGGYSSIFIEFIHYGIFIYLLLGLLSLRKVLQHFQFSEAVISVTLIATFFGTNLFYYTLSQGLMTHGFLFSLHCMFLYLTIQFYNKPKYATSLLLGLTGGLIALIRPTEVVCFVVWMLWSVNSWEAFKSRVSLLLGSYRHLILMALIFIIIWIPQIIYWHYVSGNLFIDAYAGEKLFFSDPKIMKVLFSTRNGLFPYCPVLFLYFVSLFIPNPSIKGRFGLVFFVMLNVYLVSCWWCWWYGGSYSMRALIQIYPYLAITFAGMLQYIYVKSSLKKVIKYSFGVLIFLLVLLQMKFWFQSKKGFIHYDSMTTKAYLFILPRMELNGAETQIFYSLVRSPDYKEAKLGNNR